ncbi:hypothetical protein FB567DRAFT_593109 [Paraphoma chrysanthemicola]|uniref:Uncharacterized protein n=1 Tax=Paraphoma chrysanthemicola TaxID=798071 RepID=A0A8K0R5A6_9PLEO|nr:hypothetical protein FB567DRAFT_593109 [Paraphoma chrysanthemicola]
MAGVTQYDSIALSYKTQTQPSTIFTYQPQLPINSKNLIRTVAEPSRKTNYPHQSSTRSYLVKETFLLAYGSNLRVLIESRTYRMAKITYGMNKTNTISKLEASVASMSLIKKPVDRDLRITWDEGEHADDEVIASAGDLFESTVPYWKGDKFNGNLMNGGYGRKFENSHHVKGEAEKTKRNFKALTYRFCLEHIHVKHDNQLHLVRCLNTFTIKSDGCTDHHRILFKDGPNRIYPLLKANKTVTWGMIKYQEPEMSVDEVGRGILTVREQKAALLKEVDDISAQIQLALASGDASRAQELLNAQGKLQATISAKTIKSKTLAAKAEPAEQQDTRKQASTPVNATAQLALVSKDVSQIYNARRAANANTPGLEVLDKKQRFLATRQKGQAKAKFTTEANKAIALNEDVAKENKMDRRQNKKPMGPAPAF